MEKLLNIKKFYAENIFDVDLYDELYEEALKEAYGEIQEEYRKYRVARARRIREEKYTNDVMTALTYSLEGTQ